ncbi:MAG: ABC transporter permease [Acidobacteria bacterium]|nr:ABC transporter permease [Acidobacteriota bacterium]MYJ03852.1 ABC transporter permease [Acidobacteriota bacterium]
MSPVSRSKARTMNRCARTSCGPRRPPRPPRSPRLPRRSARAWRCGGSGVSSGTGSPNGTAVRRKTLSSHTIGEADPRPGTSTFQATCSVSLQVSGGSACRETPLASGPRHCPQYRSASATCAPAGSVQPSTSHRATVAVGGRFFFTELEPHQWTVGRERASLPASARSMTSRLMTRLTPLLITVRASAWRYDQRIVSDLRFALRGLGRQPLASAVAIATLSLGLAAVTTLFAVTDAVILQPIGEDDSRLVRVWKDDVERGNGVLFPISYPEYLVWKDEVSGFEAIAAINYADGATDAVVIDDEPVTANMVRASAELLRTVGARPAYGRLLEAGDDVEGAELVAVVSHRFWRRVSGDPAFVGQRISNAGDTPITIVGVLQPDRAYPVDADIWLPLVPAFARDPYVTLDNPRGFQFHVVGRLAPGVTIGQAQSELEVIHGRLSAAYPEDYPRMPIVATPLADTVFGHVRPTLALLLAGAALVFLVAGANVAILLLMRAESRRVEMAVRSALGATRGQLLRQTVIEAGVLGVAGVGGALILSRGLLALTSVVDPGQAPRIAEASLSPQVLVFAVVAMAVWTLVFGTAPAWQTRVTRLWGFLTHRSAEHARGTGRRLQVMAAVQIAFAVVVLVAAGLLTRSLGQLQSIDRGLESDGVVTTRILLPWQRYRTPDEVRAFYDRAIEAVERIPGVISAAPYHLPPGTATTGLSSPFQFEGQTPDESATNEWANWDIAMPRYFETMGIPIVSGRAFSRTDTADAQLVAIVSESAAARYWPGEDPIGKRVRISPSFEWSTVVGVAADLRYRELINNWMTVYYPAIQSFHFDASNLAIRTERPPATLLATVRETLQGIEPSVPIDTLTPMDELLAAELARPRLAVQISIAFGLVTLVLVTVGLFGIVSFDARQRRVEMAIRSALGASPRALRRLVAWRGLRLAATGIVAGLAATALGTQALAAVLYGVSPLDPVTVAAVAGVLALVAGMACWIPARRAAATDPSEMLRSGE